MGNDKVSKYIKVICGVVIIIIGIISYFILPDKVGMQISTSGQLQNYMPKVLAVIVPVGIYALGFLYNKNGKQEEWKRHLIVSVLAVFIQVFTLALNL